MSKNKFKAPLIILAGIVIIISFITVVTQTDMFINNPGSQIYKSFYINNLVEGEIGGGYLTLVRNIETPVGVETAKFSNDDTYMFFSVTQNEQIKERMIITIPHNMASGVYFYNVTAVINNQTFTKKIRYKVH